MIYLDRAATSHPKPDTILEAIIYYIGEVGVESSERIACTSNAAKARSLTCKGSCSPDFSTLTASPKDNSVLHYLREGGRQGGESNIIEEDSVTADPYKIPRAIGWNTCCL